MLKPRAVMIHDGGEARILNATGTTLCNLQEALDRGAMIAYAFSMSNSVLLLLKWGESITPVVNMNSETEAPSDANDAGIAISNSN